MMYVESTAITSRGVRAALKVSEVMSSTVQLGQIQQNIELSRRICAYFSNYFSASNEFNEELMLTHSTVFQPRSVSWSGCLWWLSVTWFVGRHHEPALLRTLPRMLPGVAEGPQQRWSTQKAQAFTLPRLDSFAISGDEYNHQDCHQESTIKKWGASGSTRQL